MLYLVDSRAQTLPDVRSAATPLSLSLPLCAMGRELLRISTKRMYVLSTARRFLTDSPPVLLYVYIGPCPTNCNGYDCNIPAKELSYIYNTSWTIQLNTCRNAPSAASLISTNVSYTQGARQWIRLLISHSGYG